MGSSLLSEKIVDVQIRDSDILVFGISELDLVEIAAKNWVCEGRRQS